LITGSIFGRNKDLYSVKAPVVVHIFIRYDASSGELLISDKQNGPETTAHSHKNSVKKGSRVQWNWRGPHQNIDMSTITPKDADPFTQVDKVGDHLVAPVRTDIEDGDYGYNIVLIIDGKSKTFDPTLQIHH
jgi:hypothetical protein